MARRLPFLVVLIALVFTLTLAGQPAAVFAQDAPPARTVLRASDPSQPSTYIVSLVQPPLARYRGEVAGLAATSPEVTGARRLNVDEAASQAYLSYLAERRAEFLQRAEERLARKLELRHVYDVVMNGFAVDLTAEEAAFVAGLPGVRAVTPNFGRELDTDRGPAWIGAPSQWGAPASCAPGGNCGEGMIVGIIDTGINTDHPSFADLGGDGYNHTNPFGAGNYKGWCNPANHTPALTVCNDKLIGVWGYSAVDNDPQDAEGHGSHTASTVAGNRLSGIPYTTPTVNLSFDVSGVAPHANIIAYDACCDGAALISAINQAVTDGVDVINYSIGSPVASNPWEPNTDAEAFLNARTSGVFVAASAGNNGPAPSTLGMPASSPWILSVAAATHDRAMINAVVNLTSSHGSLPDLYGRSITAGLPVAPIVYAGNYGGNNLCLPGVWAANTFTNQIVVCDRGNNARVEKADNVKAAGGDGMILVNVEANGDELIGDGYSIPGVHLTYQDGVTLKNWLAAGPGNQGGILGTVNDIQDMNGDAMAAFSSRGPTLALPNVIKPDISGPGVDVLAAWATVTGFTAPEFNIISGTSMSSPHLAGAATLIAKVHPEWTPAELQSAIMTTSWTTNLRDEDGITPTNAFDVGAGRVNIENAVKAGLVLNVTTAQYDAADPALGGDPATLNLPSMGNSNCYRTCSWTRTVRNVTGQATSWTLTFVGQDGLTATLGGGPLNLAAGASGSFSLTVDDTAGLVPGQHYFGTVIAHEANNTAPDAHFPVAVRVAPSTAETVIGKTVAQRGVAAGANSPLDYTVTISNTALSARTFSVQDTIPAGATYVSKTGDWNYAGGALSWSGSLPPAVAVAEARGASSSYMSLRAAGAQVLTPPLLGYVRLGNAPISYLGAVYDDLLICRDGLVIPVKAADPNPLCGAINLELPNVNAPARAIAPWWDTLEFVVRGATTSQWYVDVQRLNERMYWVIEWENFRIAGTSAFITFQTWLALDGSDIFFAYKPGFNPGANPSATIGFQNDAKNAGASYFYNGAFAHPGDVLPNGNFDVWVGIRPATKTFGYNATASAPSGNIVNEASATVDAKTYTAFASTNVCGAAQVKTPAIAVQAGKHPLVSWAGSRYDSYELWRSPAPYVGAGGSGSLAVYAGNAFSYVDAAAPVIGDPAANYYYTLRTVNCAGTSTADSGWVGEFDFPLVKGQ